MDDGSGGESRMRISFLVIALVPAFLFLVLSLLQPVLSGAVTSWADPVLSATCHRLPERSLDLPWGTSALCARCTAFWFGTTLGCLVILITRRIPVPLPVAFVMLLPMVVDGAMQQLGVYESNAVLRGVTGFVCGFGLASVIASLSGREDTAES